jgi:phosphatidylserine synthase
VLRLKDLATLGNAACGLLSILFCVRGDAHLAAWAIMFGYAFDAVDGPIARALGGSNRFGAELDNLADHMTFGIAPAYCVYLAYVPTAPWLGAGLGGTYALAATLRHTRNLVYEAPTTLCWAGLPRPAAAFALLAVIHARFFDTRPGPWIGAALILGVVGVLLGKWPYVNHRGRAFQGWVRVLVTVWVGSWIATALFARAFFWDAVLICIAAYTLFSWTVLTRDERREFFDAMRAWKRTIAAGQAASRASGTPSAAAEVASPPGSGVVSPPP